MDKAKEKRMVVAVDIDDTLCTRPKHVESLGSPEKYEYCEPIWDMIGKVNELAKTNTIVLYTSRGMTSLGGDPEKIDKTLREVTERKLREWGVNYDRLVFGKIHFDLLIDDKALSPQEFSKKFEERKYV